MKDKSLVIFLMTVFGVSGITILMLAWLWPMSSSERIMTTFIGSTGLFMALTKAMLLRSIKTGADNEQVTMVVEVGDKP
ncbi:hypothetical protein ACFLV5_01430 [Chloroflexota bacterium]